VKSENGSRPLLPSPFAIPALDLSLEMGIEQNSTSHRRRLQVRTSLLFCVVGFVACGVSGYLFGHNYHGMFYHWPFHERIYFLVKVSPLIAPIVAWIVGRGTNSVPMAVGFLIAIPIGVFSVALGGSISYLVGLALLFAALFGLWVLLWKCITAVRLLLTASTCFCLGVWLSVLYLTALL
jgi:hypothetical protein